MSILIFHHLEEHVVEFLTTPIDAKFQASLQFKYFDICTSVIFGRCISIVTVRNLCFFMSGFCMGMLCVTFSNVYVEVLKIVLLWTCPKHRKSNRISHDFHQTS